jgi:hypothetical protein
MPAQYSAMAPAERKERADILSASAGPSVVAAVRNA